VNKPEQISQFYSQIHFYEITSLHIFEQMLYNSNYILTRYWSD